MSISSVEIIDGNSGFGACVLNEGTLSLTSVLLNDCIASSAAGGAVDDFGSLHLSTSTISTSFRGDGGRSRGGTDVITGGAAQRPLRHRPRAHRWRHRRRRRHSDRDRFDVPPR